MRTSTAVLGPWRPAGLQLFRLPWLSQSSLGQPAPVSLGSLLKAHRRGVSAEQVNGVPETLGRAAAAGTMVDITSIQRGSSLEVQEHPSPTPGPRDSSLPLPSHVIQFSPLLPPRFCASHTGLPTVLQSTPELWVWATTGLSAAAPLPWRVVSLPPDLAPDDIVSRTPDHPC